MREMPRCSVWPTVRLSMLKARRENMLATRLSTPGLSSISATSVCFILSVPIHGLEQHVLDRSAGRDHRVDVLLRRDLQVAEDRAVVGLGLLDDRAAALLGRRAQRLDP